jgi:type IV pilus assembly protein PilF
VKTTTPWLKLTGALCMTLCICACQTTQTNTLIKDPEQAARTRTAIAAEYIKKGDLDAAKRHLEQALQADPKSADANNMMGILLQQEGSDINLQRAEAYFKRAIALKTDYAQAHNNYGVYLSGRKRYAEALQQFEVAGSTLGYDGRASALVNLARTALSMGDPARAISAFEQAVNADRYAPMARFELAELLLNQGSVQAATEHYNAYLGLVGGQPKVARDIWLGMRLAHLQQDGDRLQTLADQLRDQYSSSDEYKRYITIRQTSGAVWK